jgi:putative flippase GtrA
VKVKEIIDRVVSWFYLPLFKKFIPYKTFQYAACGGGNTVFDILLFATLYNFIFEKENIDLGFITISPYIAAFLIVFPVTLFTGYWLMNNVVFHGSPLKGHTKMGRYFLVVCTNIVINYAGLKFFVEQFHFYPTPSKILVTIICTLLSYVFQRYFTFRNYSR